MVIKGRARGGPAALASHLERRDTNEEVRVRELRGVTARDVLGALREMDCMGSPATSARTLYHAAINTAPNERLTDEQKMRAADRLEKELGLTGQPRIIVEHLKKDREHMHVVFLRIDTDRMIAIPDSHNFRKHEIVARELEREFGHQIVQGVHVDRDGKDRPERTPSHDEMQQAERSGLRPQDAKKFVTRLWNQADSGKAFAAAVAAEGWVLAKGDSRDFVLIDPAGETHSLARRVDGAKAEDVRQRLADVDHAKLPNIADAKAIQKTATIRRAESEREGAVAKDPILLRVPEPANPDPSKPLKIAAALLPVVRPEVNEHQQPSPANASQSSRKTRSAMPQTKPRRIIDAAVQATERVYKKAKLFLAKIRTQPEPSEPKTKILESRTPKRPVREPIGAPKLRSAATRKPITSMPPREQQSKKRLTGAELDEMIGRQRRREREGTGPAR